MPLRGPVIFSHSLVETGGPLTATARSAPLTGILRIILHIMAVWIV